MPEYHHQRYQLGVVGGEDGPFGLLGSSPTGLGIIHRIHLRVPRVLSIFQDFSCHLGLDMKGVI